MSKADRITANAAFNSEAAAQRERDEAARRGANQRRENETVAVMVQDDAASRIGDVIGMVVSGAIMLSVAWLMLLVLAR
jgi:hypothetical protein